MTGPAELEWLADQASKHQCIAEIGSYLGSTTRVMAEHTTGTVYAVDTWDSESLPDNDHYREFRQRPKGWFFAEFCSRVSDLLRDGKVQPVQMASTDAAKSLSGVTFDMIFIDASHDYESVKADIEAWMPLLSEDGLICGHDFQPHRGVPRAVRELVPGFQVGPGHLWHKSSCNRVPIVY